MKIGTPKEAAAGEARVAMTPESALQLQKLGHACLIQSGAGVAAGFSDAAYEAAGVTVIKTAASLWKEAEVIAKVRPPTDAEVKRLTPEKTLISFFYPGQSEELLTAANGTGAHGHRDGHGAPDQPSAEDGRPVIHGEHRGLPGRDRGGEQFRAVLHGPGDGSGPRCRLRRFWWLARVLPGWRRSGHRHRLGRLRWPSTCGPKWPNRSRAWGRSSCSSTSRNRRLMGQRRGAMRRRRAPSSGKSSWRSSGSWRRISTSSSRRP